MSEGRVVLCDLDGVVWLAHEPLPGAASAIERLRSSAYRVAFVTNNSFSTVSEQEEALDRIGIPAQGDILTSAMAAARLVEPASSVLVLGGPGLVEAVRGRGAAAFVMSERGELPDRFDAVVVGLDRRFDYESLRRASEEIRRGARFVAANEDPTYPTPMGPIPGGGSVVAAVETASGRAPIVAGKPHDPMAALIRATIEDVDARTVMIGDRPTTDGAFARRLGCRFGLVRSQVSAEELGPLAIGVSTLDFDGPSLEAVVDEILESSV